jgi:hypothetical protein
MAKFFFFSVSHDHDRISLHDHFAIPKEGLPYDPGFYHYPIALFILTADDDADRYKTYHIVAYLRKFCSSSSIKNQRCCETVAKTLGGDWLMISCVCYVI